jgi:hypothetical protein
MSIEIDKAFVQQFSDNLIHLSQQRGSRLMGTVKFKRVVGNSAHFDRLGATTATKNAVRHSDTPLTDSAHSRRRVTMDDFDWADLIDKQDEIRMLKSPESDYAMSGAWALGRSIDDFILDAADGNATSVTDIGAGTTSSVSLPSTQVVDEDFTTADSDLIVEKVIEAHRILVANDVDINEDLFFVINAAAQATLFNETEIQNFDTNTAKVLANGRMNTFMGFNFVIVNRLNGVADATDTNPIKCLAYARSGIGLALGQDVEVRITERADKRYATQVYCSMTGGATRIEEEKVVQVQCVQ